MDRPLRILLVEDSETDSAILVNFLKKEELWFSYARVWTRNEFLVAVDDYKPDLIIADHNMPQFNGMEAFRLLKEKNKHIPFILITGMVSEKLLTQYMKEGVDDYILKHNLLRLPSSIENVVNKKQVEKLHDELLKANKKLDAAYTDIRDSINCARKIQNAMLTDMSVLTSVFPESFVFYQPKDVLSGDFFWFDIKGDFFYIAVADCTGHGVPGALLSMMGSSMLNETVNSLKIYEPAEILDSMNNRVRETLKPEKNQVGDGMDIALCCIHLKTHRMVYSGANHPVLVIRKGEIIQMKPDKPAVGSNNNMEQGYQTKQMPLLKGDRVFLLSDGYSDQFSSTTNKKMTVKRLKRMLIESSVIPMEFQAREIKYFFEEWKGDGEQIDDVLVVGIEI